jgi:hypothetical protein
MACRGSFRLELPRSRQRFAASVYVVSFEQPASIFLLGSEVKVELVIREDGVIGNVHAGNVRALLELPAQLQTCRWARLEFSVDEARNSLRLAVDGAVCERRLHFPLPAHVSWSTVEAVAGSDVYMAVGGKRAPAFPPVGPPTPQRKERPLRSVAELLELPLAVQLAPRCKVDSSGLLVCHDFKGNYLRSDASLDTVFDVNPSEQFVFVNWPQTRVFVYFSHERVSFPPVSWVAAARTNQCLVLGTLITEWDPEENTALFSQPVSSAERLAALAASRGFDGWLINVEAPLASPELIVGVRVFLKTLAKYCVAIMYDSITTDTG